MYVLNFYGGAGIGKSTIAADIFSKLKRMGHKTVAPVIFIAPSDMRTFQSLSAWGIRQSS